MRFSSLSNFWNSVFVLLVALQLAGCAAGNLFLDRHGLADRIGAGAGFVKTLVTAEPFVLTAYHRIAEPGEALTVYIEGDGQAWLSRSRLATDPTPTDPVALRLAALDPSPNVVYLARPCHYTESRLDPFCGPAYWSNKRFAEEVIAAMDRAVEHFRRRSRAREAHLVGYSGGGAVATLIAARRRDVASLRTVAGNLDHVTLNRHKRVSPLTGSLNPIDFAPTLSRLPQRHFVGSGDRVVPRFIAEAFARRAASSRCIGVTVVEDVTHAKGWVERWLDLLTMPVACSG